MAFPTAVNDQITDSVTQPNIKVLGDAPAVAMGNLYLATAQALGNAAHNATTAQQQAFTIAQAATTQGVALLYSLDTAAAAAAAKRPMPAPETATAGPSPLATAALPEPLAEFTNRAPVETGGVPAEMVALQLAFATSLAMHATVLQQQQTQIALQAAQTMALATLMIRDPGAVLEQLTQTIVATEAQSIATMKALSTLVGQGTGSAGA